MASTQASPRVPSARGATGCWISGVNGGRRSGRVLGGMRHGRRRAQSRAVRQDERSACPSSGVTPLRGARHTAAHGRGENCSARCCEPPSTACRSGCIRSGSGPSRGTCRRAARGVAVAMHWGLRACRAHFPTGTPPRGRGQGYVPHGQGSSGRQRTIHPPPCSAGSSCGRALRTVESDHGADLVSSALIDRRQDPPHPAGPSPRYVRTRQTRPTLCLRPGRLPSSAPAPTSAMHASRLLCDTGPAQALWLTPLLHEGSCDTGGK